MKKNFIRTFITLSIFSLAFASFLLACNFDFSGKDLLTKPDVEAKDSLISISIPRRSSDTKYVNVYRKDVNDSDGTIVNLGLLYPSSLEDVGSVYIFIDTLVKKDSTYIYMARYCEADGYYSTEWSNEIKTTGGYDKNASLSYKSGSGYFTISTDFHLTVHGSINPADITNFETDYKPMLIASTAEKTQTFELPSIENGTSISLRGLFPADFFETDVTIYGITGQKNEYVDDNAENLVVKRIFWCEPTEISIKGNADKTVKLSSQNGVNGLDYSKKAFIVK